MRRLVFFILSALIPMGAYGADILELVKALDANDTAKFKSIVITSEDANAFREDNNKTVLMYACWVGNKEAVDHLLSKNADISAQDSGGTTALHLAIWKGHDAIAAALLRNGASANAMSKEGMTPVDIATMRGNQLILDEIQKYTVKLKPLL